MKFIVDAQLPKSLSEFFNKNGLNSIHTIDLPNGNKTSDRQIAKLANDEERTVVTKDVDFLLTFLLNSEPAKLIIIKTGNISNTDLVNIFRNNLGLILQMISRSNLLEISKTEIAEHY